MRANESSRHYRPSHILIYLISENIENLEATIKKIADSFFAHDSPAAVFLNEYVKGTKRLPVTTEGIVGLPRMWRRVKISTAESQPNFLFLDLPVTPTDNTTPTRFKSNAVLQELEKDRAQDVPVFGVSGVSPAAR